MRSLLQFTFVAFFTIPLSAAPLPELCKGDRPEMEIISRYGLEGVWQRLTQIWQQGAQNELPGRERIADALFGAKQDYLMDVSAGREISTQISKFQPEIFLELDLLVQNFISELKEESLESKMVPWEHQAEALQNGEPTIKEKLVQAYLPSIQKIFQSEGLEEAEAARLAGKLLQLLPDGPLLIYPKEFMEVHDYVMGLVEVTKTFPSSMMKLPHGSLLLVSDINQINNAGLNINIAIRYPEPFQGENLNLRLTFSPLPRLADRISMKLCSPEGEFCELLPIGEFCDQQ